MATDNIAGHTAAQNTLGEDGLRDGDSLSPTTLTNALQGIHGNGILRYQDGAFGSTRNDTNTGNQPGSMVRTTASTLTVSGGFAVLDGALYEFGTGVGDTITLDLNDGSHGTGALTLAANQEAIYTIFVAPSGGVNKVHYEAGSPVDTTTGLYPSASNQYLINYKTLSSGDNAKAIALAQVRVQYIASGGGSNNLNIIEINDKRVFLHGAADYRIPLSVGVIDPTGAGGTIGAIRDSGADGINTIAHLNAIHNDNGELAITDTVNVHWVSHPRYGVFSQSPPGASDAGYGQGPSRGADRGGGHVADTFYFAGRNNEKTGHYSVRLQGRGVDATTTALTTSGIWKITADGDSFFMLSPNAGVDITLQPEQDASSNYEFPEGHTIEVCNNGLGNIIFDDLSGSNETVGPAHRATFIYEGSVWVRCDYQSAIIAAGPAPAIYDNSGTPAFTSGITKAEVLTLLNVEDGADVTDATNVNAAGAIMHSDLGTKGDLAVGDGAGDVTILGVGTNNHVLTADSSEPSGVKWAAASGGGAAPAIEDNSGTPAFATGITKAEVLTLINVEDGADVTDATNVTAAGALMDSEVTNLAFVKGLAGGISNGNVLVANANVADNDFLKVDGTSIEGRTAAETLSDIGAVNAAGAVTAVQAATTLVLAGDVEIAAGSVFRAQKSLIFPIGGFAPVTLVNTTHAGKILMGQGGMTVVLPLMGVGTEGETYVIINTNAPGAGAITIDATTNGHSLNGAASNGSLPAHEAVTLIYTGALTGWYGIGL